MKKEKNNTLVKWFTIFLIVVFVIWMVWTGIVALFPNAAPNSGDDGIVATGSNN